MQSIHRQLFAVMALALVLSTSACAQSYRYRRVPPEVPRTDRVYRDSDERFRRPALRDSEAAWEYRERVAKAEREYAEERLEWERDEARGRQRALREYQEELAEARRDYDREIYRWRRGGRRDLARAEYEYRREVREAELEYDEDLRKLDRKIAEKRYKAEREYWKDIEKAERKLDEDLREEARERRRYRRR